MAKPSPTKKPAKKPPPKPSNREPDREPRAQFAALPWRRNADGEVEVLLITSRETRRWVIPKGWPIKGMKSPKSAAREAFEEAGVLGRVAKTPIGAYAYDKRLKNGRLQHVRVAVFALSVESEAETYPELGQREKRWLPLADAARLVAEPELMVVLATFRPGAGKP
jgi:8-oxo-dGTP pyrophosphatase MutT (NUDIX family)